LKAILIDFGNGNVHRYPCNAEGEAIGPFARATRRDLRPVAAGIHPPPPFLMTNEPGGLIVPPQNLIPAAAPDAIEPADFDSIWGTDPLSIASVDDAFLYQNFDGPGEASAFSWEF
jgi:hypothetical protein